jgi:NADH:ubiquinone oxidoreductase subunit F (NADH-binding)
MLTTIYPAGGGGRVAETAIGTPLRTLLGTDAGTQAWLVGGYHGSWLPLPDSGGLTLDNESLRGYGAAAGAGVLAVLPSRHCGLTETARVVAYLAAESAGRAGGRPGSVQPSGRHDPVRPQCLAGLRARAGAPPTRPLHGR